MVKQTQNSQNENGKQPEFTYMFAKSSFMHRPTYEEDMRNFQLILWGWTSYYMPFNKHGKMLFALVEQHGMIFFAFSESLEHSYLV